MKGTINLRKLSFEEITNQRLTKENIKDQKRFPIYSVLDNIRSMYNVGSVFRTSDACRIEKLILCGMTAYPPRKEIEKTALGSVETVPWAYKYDSLDAVKSFKEKGITTIAVEHTTNSIDYRKVQIDFPVALVFGHEVDGVKEEVVKECDIAIEIPMFGVKQSLNLAVSYGIVLYEFVYLYLDQLNKLSN